MPHNKTSLKFIVATILLLSHSSIGLTQNKTETATKKHHHHMQHDSHAHHNMSLDETGMVMNSNSEKLPPDCDQISQDYQFTVYAGVEYAHKFPGKIFGMNQHEYKIKPCSRISVTFVNKDQVRHQWMVHGLPKYLYPQGMFHLEAAGGQQQSGTFIVPSDNKTYLVHCDLAQHMEKGMKAQLVVGSGSGDLWSIPEVSREFRQDSYLPANILPLFFIAMAVGIVIAVVMNRQNKA